MSHQQSHEQHQQRWNETIENTHTLMLEIHQCLTNSTSNGGNGDKCDNTNNRAKSIQLLRLLTRIKKEMVPPSSSSRKEEEEAPCSIYFEFVANNNESIMFIISTLLSIINDNGGDVQEKEEWEFSTTDGHREMSCDILRAVLQSLFANANTDIGMKGNNSNSHKGGSVAVRDIDGDGIKQVEVGEMAGRKGDSTDAFLQQKQLFKFQTNLLHQYSITFQKRMTRQCSSINAKSFSSSWKHETMAEPVESSEYIRLLLVELLVDLVGYVNHSLDSLLNASSCATETNKLEGMIEEGNNSSHDNIKYCSTGRMNGSQYNNKLILLATSNICTTLSKSTFFDPYPEIQRASCVLIEKLTRMCPMGVHMHSGGLLFPLTGILINDVHSSLQPGQLLASAMASSSSSSSGAMSKRCLFRHRHAKTRSEAVNASVAIVLCCPNQKTDCHNREALAGDNDDHNDDNIHHGQEDSKKHAPASHSDALGDNSHLFSHGSRSTSMEQLLHDILLPGWEDLVKVDSSASVRISVLNALEKVACMLGWSYSPSPHESSTVIVSTDDGTPKLGLSNDEPSSQDNGSQGEKVCDMMDVTSLVEARVLSLFLLGMSDGNVDQVRRAAIRGFCSLGANQNNTKTKVESIINQCVQWDLISKYFQPTLELVLLPCSNNWATCQNKVRSLEALQVLLSVSIPLLEKESSIKPPNSNQSSFAELSSAVRKENLQLSKFMTSSITNALSTNILSEENDVLEAALVCCRIIGSSDTYAKNVLELLTTNISNEKYEGATSVMEEVENMEVGDSLEEPSSQSELTSTATMSNSPRQMTSILLILDGMMKGCLSNKDVTLILHGIDTNISIESSTWFNSSYSSSKAIGTLICNRTITDNVVSNFSMAWALLDACSSFVKCATERHGLFDQSGSKCDVEDEVILRVLTSIVFLLGCPREFDVFSHAMKVLDDFSTFHNNGAEPIGRRTLLDTHFRQLLPKIASVGPSFPWQHTDPTMLTMCALLRTSNGSTVGSNFDIVAPFFIHHLSTTGYKVVEKELASTHDDVAEEYSLRISLMSLLQTILSDGSFSETLNDNTSSSSTASFSKQFTTDVLLSLVLPNLVWKAGGLASALRKLSAATLFSLLSHHCIIQHENRNISNEPKTPYPETLTHLIPILHSNLEDTESITRELCCTCLSLVLEQVSKSDFQAMWEANTQIVDTLYPRLLTLLDDSHNPVRVAACRTLEQFLSITHHSPSSSPTCRLGLSSFEGITTTLMIQLDDPDQEVQNHVFQTLMVILDLQFQDAKKPNGHHLSEMQIKVVEMMERHSKAALKSHRNGHHCDLLIKKIQEYKQQGMMCTSN